MDEWPVVHDKTARRFAVALGDEAAELTYSLSDGSLVINHTRVPRAWEGRGIAASLTRAALDYARSRGLRVVPLCSYAAGYLRRHPEYRDLADANW